jgi:hypothetical protein
MQVGVGGDIVKLQNFNTDFNWIQRNGIVSLPEYAENEEVLFSGDVTVSFWICADHDDGLNWNNYFCILYGSDPGS